MDKATLEALFNAAVSNLANASVGGNLGQGKMYELYVLLVVLKKLNAAGYSVSARSKDLSHLRFGGSPCTPDKAKYTYFAAQSPVSPSLEVWLSVQVTTLSSELAGGRHLGKTSFHEMDVAVFEGSLVSKQMPEFKQLVLACTCKYRPASKEQVREALGLRRETALLTDPNPSRAPWFISSDIPAKPATPIVLVSKDPSAGSFRYPVERLGVYVLAEPMP